MYLTCLFSLAIITVIHADVSHLANNLQADGYHYEQPSFPFPSENEIIPQQPISGRNDFNPPAFLAQQKPVSQQPVAHEYIPPAPATNLQQDGYHYQQPLIPFPSANEVIPEQSLSGRNDFNPPAFLAQQKPEEPAPQQPEPEQPAVQVPEYIAPQPSYVDTNLQEDGYHYQQPSIPFESQQPLSGRNDFNPPAFLLAKPEQPEEPAPEEPAPEAPVLQEPEPEEPAPQEPESEQQAVQIPEYIAPESSYVDTNLQEDGYHYQQPSIPFDSQQPLSGRNDFNPPAFLFAKPEKPEEPAPEEPAPQEPEPVEPEVVEPQPEIQTSEEPASEEPASEEPASEEPASEEPVFIEPVQPLPTTSVETNLQDDGYHYTQPSIPFVQPQPAQEYLPVAQPEPQPEISSYFDPEPSYSLGPDGYNYRVPSRPFRF